MLGAIIGDLAAWTWEHDRETFYKSLVSPDAKLSECGLAVLLFADSATANKEYTWREVYSQLSQYVFSPKPDAIEISQETKQFLGVRDQVIPYTIKKKLCAAGIVVSGWNEPYRKNAMKWVQLLHGGKQEGYGTYLSEVIGRLRSGSTKAEALKDIPVINDWKSDNRSEFLSNICFALRCFERSWDFTSAIHNAMQSTDDIHLAGMLVGGIAEAMYSCEQMLIKQKFSNEFHTYISFPESIQNLFGDDIQKIRAYKESVRVFFPKNRALTNVERHVWTPVENPYKDWDINPTLHRRMLKAFDTGWENRFGIYLDDGWFYIYRSYCLLYRFKLIDHKIVAFQKSDDKHGVIDAVDAVIYCLKREYALYGSETFPNIEHCKYYHGEDEMPKSIKNTVAGKFWHGEMMFVTHHIDMEQWKENAEQCIKGLTGKRKASFSKYYPEQRAIILYTETLFGEFCPYDDFSWIFEY